MIPDNMESLNLLGSYRRPRRRYVYRPRIDTNRRFYPFSLSDTNIQILNRFSDVLDSHIKSIQHQLQQPNLGRIRILDPPYHARTTPLEYEVHTYDRTIREWHQLFDMYKSLSPSVFLNPQQHVSQLERIYYHNMKLRWILRKWIMKVRIRIMNKRIVGNTDLFSMSTIPTEDCVSVYDTKTRCLYKFHVNTAYRLILSSLKYHQYGIASPQTPKNPYTNIPWNFGQIMRIMQQIFVHYFNKYHSFTTLIMRLYRLSSYDISTFYKQYSKILNINAANAFFADHDDPNAKEIYLEILDDIYFLINTAREWITIRKKIYDRKLPDTLMKKWDNIIIIYWIYQNHNIIYKKNATIDDIDNDLNKLYKETHTYVKELEQPIIDARPKISVVRRL